MLVGPSQENACDVRLKTLARRPRLEGYHSPKFQTFSPSGSSTGASRTHNKALRCVCTKQVRAEKLNNFLVRVNGSSERKVKGRETVNDVQSGNGSSQTNWMAANKTGPRHRWAVHETARGERISRGRLQLRRNTETKSVFLLKIATSAKKKMQRRTIQRSITCASEGLQVQSLQSRFL